MFKFWKVALLPAIVFFLAHSNCAAGQYKRVHRSAMIDIVSGKPDKAIKRCEKFIKEHPSDAESHYILAVAYARKKQISPAVEHASKALNAGLPFERFLAGPRETLKPLTRTAGFKMLARRHPAELLHGPMLGNMTDSSVCLWVRTGREVPVKATFGTTEDIAEVVASATGKTSSEDDFTVVLKVTGLKPATLYHYKLAIDGKEQPGRWSCRTFPPAGKGAKFEVGFGGGAGYTPKYERMWKTIESHKLTAFLTLGDNVYIDRPKMPAVQQYHYYRRQSRPEFRSLCARTPFYAVWDDHDFVTNDARGGPEIDEPAWKRPVWRIFKQQWANPYYGGGEQQPGCWFDFSIADVDFFMLDSRYYRTNPKKENPTMLGPVQKKWLLKKLKASKATFKVIASPVPWSYGSKPGSRDPWQGYKSEREEIFSCINDNRIDGVVLIAADRHRSDAWKIERENGYTLYEFESSKLTNIHTHGIMRGCIFGYNKKCSFGTLAFDTTRPDPEVTYKIFNIDDKHIYSLKLTKSRLSHRK